MDCGFGAATASSSGATADAAFGFPVRGAGFKYSPFASADAVRDADAVSKGDADRGSDTVAAGDDGAALLDPSGGGGEDGGTGTTSSSKSLPLSPSRSNAASIAVALLGFISFTI